MLNCKRCRTSIFFDWNNRKWQSVAVGPCIDNHLEHEPNQSAEFYVTGNGLEILYGTDNLVLVRNGEMRLKAKTGEFFHYSDQLVSFGITNDDELDKVLKVEFVEIINNPWFEILNKLEDEDYGIYDTLNDGLDAMLKMQDEIGKQLEKDLHVSKAIDEAINQILDAQHASDN